MQEPVSKSPAERKAGNQRWATSFSLIAANVSFRLVSNCTAISVSSQPSGSPGGDDGDDNDDDLGGGLCH